MKIKAFIGSVVVAGAFMASSLAGAAVTFDAETGEGFVPKADVQFTYEWNNKQLQDGAADVRFRVQSEEIITWTCSRTDPQEQIRPRHRTVTSAGVATTVARENSKGKNGSVTGFNLTGWDGDPVTESDGHALESCGGGGFTFDEGSLETEAGDGTAFQVSRDGGSTWNDLLSAP